MESQLAGSHGLHGGQQTATIEVCSKRKTDAPLVAAPTEAIQCKTIERR